MRIGNLLMDMEIMRFLIYEISDHGNVRHVKTQRILKHIIDKGGYHIAILYYISIPSRKRIL
jgi:hypothetical protein